MAHNVIQFVSLTLSRVSRIVRYDEAYSHPSTVAKIVGPDMAGFANVRVWAVALDAQNRMNAITEVSSGGITECPVPVRTFAQFALLANAASVILVTNMPSGTPTISHETRANHKSLAEGLAPLDIMLLDTVVIGNGQYMSISDEAVRPI